MIVSETLRKVANSEWYENGWDLMCLSIADAHCSGLITYSESVKARQAIRKFIGNYSTMSEFLKDHNVRSDYEYRKALYSDWDNRYTYLGKELTFWQKVKLFFKSGKPNMFR